MKDLFSRFSHFQTPVLNNVFLLVFFSLAGCAHQLPPARSSPPFDWNTDRFAFANETVFTYDPAANPEKESSEKEKEAYTRRCFVMTRAALQFRKFARFDTQAPACSDQELAERVRRIASKPVWESDLPARERIVLPGKHLFDFSGRHASLLQKEIGEGWPIYFRPGNMAMPFPVSRGHQERTAGEMRDMIARGQPSVLWLTRFPSLAINHSVLAYAVRDKNGLLEFDVYDPNYKDTPKKLIYDPKALEFSYEKTFYFKGGPVIARTVYWSHLQ